MDLPDELVQKILEYALIFKHEIELSPIGNRNREDYALGPCQYQMALDYQTKVRPTLSILRVCHTFHKLGARAYYSGNAFRFSSVYGWLTIARFFSLIGANNIRLLRNITIVHPSLAFTIKEYYDESFWEDTCDFYLRRLSPFGMVDIEGYEETYDQPYDESDDTTSLVPAEDPLATIRGIRGLRKLRFLSYPRRYWDDGFRPEHVVELRENLFAQPLQPFSRDDQPRLTVTLINLIPNHEWAWTLSAEPIQRRTPAGFGWWLPVTQPPDFLTTFHHNIKELGWRFEEQPYAPDTGIWPLGEDEPVPSEESGYGPYCDDPVGWHKRERFQELGTQPSVYNGIFLFSFEEYTQYKGTTFGCVKCWGDIPPSPSACTCKDGPTLLPDWDWRPRGFVLGNPGTPVEVDVTMAAGENVTFKKSHFVKQLEHWLEHEEGGVTDRFIYHKISGGSMYSKGYDSMGSELQYNLLMARDKLKREYEDKEKAMVDRLNGEGIYPPVSRRWQDPRGYSHQGDMGKLHQKQRQLDEKEAALVGPPTMQRRPKACLRRWSLTERAELSAVERIGLQGRSRSLSR